MVCTYTELLELESSFCQCFIRKEQQNAKTIIKEGKNDIMRRQTYSSITRKNPSVSVLFVHITLVQLDIQGSPLSQLLRKLLGSIKLFFTARKAFTANENNQTLQYF